MDKRLPVVTVTMNPALDKTVTVDRFSPGSLNRIQEIRVDAGGKGINVAKVLHQFPIEVVAAGLIGGYQGKLVLGKLQEIGVHSRFTEAQGETRVNLKVVDSMNQQTTELNEPGYTVDSAVLEQFISEFECLAEQASFIVLAGSLPPGIPTDLYKQLIEIGHKYSVRTILDADGEAFAQGIQAKPFAIKPNIHELEALFDRTFVSEAEVIDAARSLIGQGIQYVSVSMGADGSLLIGEEQKAVKAIPFPIKPLSTVGSGDSMVAAMVYCFSQNKSFEDIARWSSAAGTVTASKPGTEVCSHDEVVARLPLVHIHSL